MISDQLPIIQIVILLVASPLCVIFRNGNWAWAIATLSTWIVLGIVSYLTFNIIQEGPISYHLGGWRPPFGIEYSLDSLNIYIILLTVFIASIILPYSKGIIKKEIEHNRRHLFYSIFLLALLGLIGIAATGDLFNVYVFLEISSLATYVLIGLGRKRQSLKAAYRYLIQGTIGATFILIGIGFLYSMTGTLNMSDLSTRLQPIIDTRPVIAGISIITVGILIKLALFPLHLWLPAAYTHAPTVVSAFLAAVSTKVGAYLLLRFIYSIIGPSLTFDSIPLLEILLSLASLAILVGAIIAIFQNDIRRLLAFSSISQIGYLVVGISIPTVTGLTGGIVHIANHGITKGAMFMTIGCITYSVGETKLKNLNGLAKRMPFTSAALLIGGLSLIGVPGTAGFIGKWYIVQAALDYGLWPVAIIVLLGSLLAIIYVGKVLESIYFSKGEIVFGRVEKLSIYQIIPVWLLIIATIYFGIHTDLTLGISIEASNTLVGGQ